MQNKVTNNKSWQRKDFGYGLNVTFILTLFVDRTYQADNWTFMLVEYVDKIGVFILNGLNRVATAKEYTAAHPNRRHASGVTFKRRYDRSRETGTVRPHKWCIIHRIQIF